MIKATLIHPDYPVILSNLFPPVNYYTKQSLAHLSACHAQADTVFDVVVDACPEPCRRDEVKFFFGETVMLRKDFVDSFTVESFTIREILLPNNEGLTLHSLPGFNQFLAHLGFTLTGA